MIWENKIKWKCLHFLCGLSLYLHYGLSNELEDIEIGAFDSMFCTWSFDWATSNCDFLCSAKEGYAH